MLSESDEAQHLPGKGFDVNARMAEEASIIQNQN